MKRLAVTLAALAMLLGCTLGELLRNYPDPYSLTNEFVIGTWEREDGEGTYVFKEDGTFTATNMECEFKAFPQLLPAKANAEDLIEGSGTWEIGRPPGGSTKNHVKLHVRKLGKDHPAAHGTSLGAYSEDGKVWLSSDECGKDFNKAT